jgi:integrase
MASLYRRKGVWYLHYVYQGKQYRKSTGTKDYKLAEIKLKELELDFFKGTLQLPEKKNESSNLPSFFRRYAEFSNSTKSNATNLSDQYRIKQIREYFARQGIKSLEEITPGELQKFQAFILLNHNARTYNNFLGLLRAMLNKAVEWDLISANPIKGIKPLKVTKKIRFLTNDEIFQLREAADTEMRLVIDLALYAGLRRAEIYYLRWKDIDLERKAIHVRAHGEFIPKGRRPGVVPMKLKLLEILKKTYPSMQNKETNSFVIKRHHDGKPLNPTQVLSNRFGRIAKKAGVKKVGLHDLRHTFASHLVQAGVPILVVKELMRHNDIQSTMIYAHLTPDLQHQAVEKLTY